MWSGFFVAFSYAQCPATAAERSRSPEFLQNYYLYLSMKGYTYILQCSDGSYYTGSTKDIQLRLQQHQNSEGANHTKKRLPVKLVYYEEFDRIDEAFYREKQIQGWSRKKKEALIQNMPENLHDLAKCWNETSHVAFDSAPATNSNYAQITKSNED